MELARQLRARLAHGPLTPRTAASHEHHTRTGSVPRRPLISGRRPEPRRRGRRRVTRGNCSRRPPSNAALPPSAPRVMFSVPPGGVASRRRRTGLARDRTRALRSDPPLACDTMGVWNRMREDLRRACADCDGVRFVASEFLDVGEAASFMGLERLSPGATALTCVACAAVPRFAARPTRAGRGRAATRMRPDVGSPWTGYVGPDHRTRAARRTRPPTRRHNPASELGRTRARDF